MAIARIKNWIPGEVLFASDQNGEFNNIINNALALISPLTGTLDANNNPITNFRFEVKTATQSASQSARAYWQSTEGILHLDTGTVIGRIPAITALEANMLVGSVNPSGVSGATTYAGLRLGSGLSVSSNTLTVSSPTSILQVQVFS